MAFASLNAVAGQNKDMVKSWIKSMPIRKKKDNGQDKDKKLYVSPEFADRLASLIMASHYLVGEGIMKLFVLHCKCGINPETSPSFNEKMLTKAIPAHSHTLQEKATDFSLRASSAKHKKQDGKPKDSELAF